MWEAILEIIFSIFMLFATVYICFVFKIKFTQG